MIPREGLKSVIEELIKKEQHQQARDLLEFFEKQADSITDYDCIGACAIRAHHHELRLKSAQWIYANCSGPEQLFDARENLYKAYNTLNQPEKALFYIELSLKQRPDDVETLMNKAFNLSLLGKKKEAEDILEKIITEDPTQKETLEFALSGKMLREGRTAEGIRAFIETFKSRNHLFADQLKLKFWDGLIQPGKTIVVNGEGGIGDEMINIRFFKNLKDLGMHPILYSSWHMHRPDTVSLFRRHGWEVTTNHLFFKKDWLWTHMMSLPGYLNLNEDDLWTGPYLSPLRQEKNNLNDSNFKIGIKCSGNPYFEQDIYRSIPIDQMLAALPNTASIYYIDKEHTHPNTINLKDRITSWEDTLDFIDQMDVIVSSCTSIVHAAGAMGKRTIVIVPIAEYYLWTTTKKNTAWYGDNFTVVRQTVPRSWKEPLEQVRQLLC